MRRALRRVTLSLVGVLVMFTAQTTAAAVAVTGHHAAVTAAAPGFDHYPAAGRVLLVLSGLIPLASAFLTAYPSHVTGLLTMGLSALGGILSDLAAHGWDTVTWQAFYTAVASWALAGGVHALVTRPKKDAETGTMTGPEAALHRRGPKLGKAA